VRRRLPLIIAVLAALAIPAIAIAATKNYGGKLGPPGANIELSAYPKHGPTTKVTRFAWNNVPTQCGRRGSSATTGDLHRDMKVNKKKKFHGTFHLNSGHETVEIHGRFKHKGKKASGTLRVTGNVPGCSNSDTGVVHWKVHRHHPKKKHH